MYTYEIEVLEATEPLVGRGETASLVSAQVQEGPVPDLSGGEVELDGVIEALFNKRGLLDLWMKEILVVEGYWG